jgi:lysosomal acid lipase/cholesteryl ester hydrolase
MAEISDLEDTSKISSSEYWNFSFHEMGIYDTPAYFQKISEINPNIDGIIYIGHSQGGASILAGMCEKLEYYKQKLIAVILLAPASRLDNHDSSLLSTLHELKIDKTLEEKNIYEILPYLPEMKSLSMKISKYYPTLNHAMMEMVSDENSLVICPNRLKIYTSHYPSGTSLKSLLHFKQIMEAKTFQHYDYGSDENLKRYGMTTPKIYDLSKIRGIPIILCGGLKDKLTHIKDVQWLRNELLKTNSLFSYYEYEYMGHVSFLLQNDITWFNNILRDVYKILQKEKKVEI